MINIRKSGRVAAITGALLGSVLLSTTFGAASASAMDDVIRQNDPSTWVLVNWGVFGYDSPARDWVLYERYRTNTDQRHPTYRSKCHYASKPGPAWNC